MSFCGIFNVLNPWIPAAATVKTQEKPYTTVKRTESNFFKEKTAFISKTWKENPHYFSLALMGVAAIVALVALVYFAPGCLIAIPVGGALGVTHAYFNPAPPSPRYEQDFDEDYY